jgi:hypothetical protein
MDMVVLWPVPFLLPGFRRGGRGLLFAGGSARAGRRCSGGSIFSLTFSICLWRELAWVPKNKK